MLFQYKTSLTQRVAIGLFVVTAAVSFGLVPLSGCGTPTQAVSLPLNYVKAPSTLTSNTQWEIKLSEATLSFGALRCLEGKAAYTWATPLRQFGQWLPMQAAFAHPDHSLPLGVKAELIFSQTLDLLQPKTPAIGALQGFSGDYGSMELEFSAKDLLSLKGVAVKGQQSVAFAFSVIPGKYLVVGISFAQQVTAPAPTLELRVSLDRLFQWVDFAAFQEKEGAFVPNEATSNVLQKALHSNALYQIAATPAATQ